MKIGTKLEMDNGEILGIQQGVITSDDGWEGVITWDEPEPDEEQLGDNYAAFGIRILPEDWEFKYINDDGTLK